eukprot:Lankesteria_metandrocarpae@DN1604_c0_g1_i2.p1
MHTARECSTYRWPITGTGINTRVKFCVACGLIFECSADGRIVIPVRSPTTEPKNTAAESVQDVAYRRYSQTKQSQYDGSNDNSKSTSTAVCRHGDVPSTCTGSTTTCTSKGPGTNGNGQPLFSNGYERTATACGGSSSRSGAVSGAVSQLLSSIINTRRASTILTDRLCSGARFNLTGSTTGRSHKQSKESELSYRSDSSVYIPPVSNWDTPRTNNYCSPLTCR